MLERSHSYLPPPSAVEFVRSEALRLFFSFYLFFFSLISNYYSLIRIFFGAKLVAFVPFFPFSFYLGFLPLPFCFFFCRIRIREGVVELLVFGLAVLDVRLFFAHPCQAAMHHMILNRVTSLGAL